MRKILISLAVVCCITTSALAQSITPSVINAAGTTFKVPSQNFYIDWSIAEMTLVNTMKPPAPHHGLYVITNGYLQPDKKEEGDDDDDDDDEEDDDKIITTLGFTSNEIKVFPNPTIDHVEVHFFMAGTGKARLTLFNNVGQLVYSKELTIYNKGSMEKISMTRLTPGTYMLHIMVNDNNNSNKKQGSYKIIKM